MQAVKAKKTSQTLKASLKSRPKMSAGEIREKVKKNKEGKVENLPEKTAPKIVSTMSDDFVEIERKGEEAKKFLAQKKAMEEVPSEIQEEKVEEKKPSDIKKNDPKDPLTGSKLKDILSKGAFKFSDKERENLERILS